MKPLLTIGLLLILIVSFQNCSETNDIGDGVYSSEVMAKANFQWIYRNVLVPKCSECHSGSLEFGGLNVMSYSRVVEFVIPGDSDNSPLYTRAFNTTTFTLTKTEHSVIAAWIDNGAENN